MDNVKPALTRELVSPYLSYKLKTLSLVAVFLVVFHHAYNLDVRRSSQGVSIINFSIQHFLSQGGLAAIAVPFFFLVSGILFFFNLTTFSYAWYLKKINTRLRTLLVPYLFWSICSICIFFILQSLPVVQNFFKAKISNLSFYDLLILIFIKPPAFQLWFIRDLLVLTILSPILIMVSKLGNFFNTIFLAVLSLFWLLQIDFIFVSMQSVLFFSLGAYLVIRKSSLLNRQGAVRPIFLFFLLITLIIIKIFLQYSLQNSQLIEGGIIIVGLLSLWIGYDAYYEQVSRFVLKHAELLKLSPFFIYAAHEPLLSLVKNFALFLFNYSDVARIVTYIFSPILILVFLAWANKVLINFFPNFYSIISGERK